MFLTGGGGYRPALVGPYTHPFVGPYNHPPCIWFDTSKPGPLSHLAGVKRRRAQTSLL